MSIAVLKSRYYDIARRLAAPKPHVTFATSPRHDGGPHIEQRGERYFYVITERGMELERRSTTSPDDILYWLVSDLTWNMATEYELAHREPNRDSRRLLFRTHLRLLESVNPQWSGRKLAEYEAILLENPFAPDFP